MAAALVLYATPLFWLSLLAIILFSVMLGWLPAFGMESVGAGLTGMSYVLDVARHLILPTVSLGCFFMAIYVRLTRASMLEVMRSEEHTSELQSLMRISYAVFCLKKKKKH